MQKLSGIISVFIVCGILSFSHPDICFAAQDFPQDYMVKSVSALECFDAKVTVLEHDLTGARVVLISNDDPNRYFMPVFNTPVSDDRGIPHVFEHSAMNGSKKYSSRNLYKALSSKGFVTFANAYTQDRCTAYPVASLSEKQLLKLADYYTDLCFEPLILTDEDIFRSEAWSYSLADEKADITVGGTIYSEMMNTYSADRDALRRAVRLLYPDSSAAHEAGGVPDDLLTLSYDDVKRFHSMYYHPSNCTVYIYGDIEEPGDFLKLLDGYFDAYDRKKMGDIPSLPSKLSGFTKREYDFPATADTSAEDGSEMVYAFDMEGMSGISDEQLYAFRNFCNRSSSTMMMSLLGRFPSAGFEMGIEAEKGVRILTVNAHRMKKEDADAFKECVSKLLSDMAKNGADDGEIENFRKQKECDCLLADEGANPALMLLLNSALLESNDMGPVSYMNMMDGYRNMTWFDNDTVKTVSSQMIKSPRSVLVTVTKKPGLAEEKEALLKKELADKKSKMTKEEIAKLVADTKRIKEGATDDPAKYLKQLCETKVSDLGGDVPSFALSDLKDKFGTRRIGVKLDKKGINSTKLWLDASGLDKDDVFYLALYADIVNGSFVPAGGYKRDDLPGMIAASTVKGQEISLVVSSFGKDYTPYVTVDFMCLCGDEADAFDLASVRLFESDFSDTDRIGRAVATIQRVVRSNIEQHPERMTMLLAASSSSNGAAYYENTHYIEYYDFLRKVAEDLEKDPEKVTAKLDMIAEHLNTKRGAILSYAVCLGEKKEYLKEADAFIGKMGDKEHKKITYDLTSYKYPLAVVTDSPLACNAVSYDSALSWPLLSELSLSMLTERYLWDLVRNMNGAYTCSYENSDALTALYSSQDPNTSQTIEAFWHSSDAWKSITGQLSEDDLNDCILSVYAKNLRSKGEITDAMNVATSMAKGKSAYYPADCVKELKSIKLSDLKRSAGSFELAGQDGQAVTTGPGQLIEEDKDFYRTVLRPFAK